MAGLADIKMARLVGRRGGARRLTQWSRAVVSLCERRQMTGREGHEDTTVLTIELSHDVCEREYLRSISCHDLSDSP